MKNFLAFLKSLVDFMKSVLEFIGSLPSRQKARRLGTGAGAAKLDGKGQAITGVRINLYISLSRSHRRDSKSV